MIEVLASVPASEPANSPGWFLVHSIGMGMGILGLVFFLGTAVGMVRFPDFYTRMHAAGVTDTLCAGLFFGGLMIHFGLTLASAKLFLIFLFMLFTCPTSTHALAKAARHSGLEPWTKTSSVEQGASK